MHKVVHIIPYDGIGGVEIAARSMAGIKHVGIDFKIEYIFPKKSIDRQRITTFNPFHFFSTFFRVFSSKPDLLIVSLWRSCIVGIFLKLFRPHLRVVLFLHLPNDVHFFDKVMTRMMARFACQIWSDSTETLCKRLPKEGRRKGKVISYLTYRIKPLEECPLEPVFIFWGRIHTQKGLDRAVQIISKLKADFPNVRYKVIGPDGGDLNRIKSLVEELELGESIDFLDAMSFNEIRTHAQSATFYLQTSVTEGMALSVVEAMQLGLVPVVTPVGEISSYCRHAQNSIIINSNGDAVADISEVLVNKGLYENLRRNAIETWSEKPLYSESVLKASEAILNSLREQN